MMSYCQINDNKVLINGKRVEFDFVDGVDWKKSIYKSLGIDYPKFYKMDDLSKLSILGIKLIENSGGLDGFGDSDISMIFCNKNVSTYTDNKYRETLEIGMPSPSIFVYTLPSTCVGELTIFKKYYGSSCFYVTDSLESLPLNDLIEIELGKGYKGVLFSWVEKSEDTDFGLFFTFNKSPTDEDLALITRLIK